MYSSKWVDVPSYFFSFIALFLITTFYLEISINLTLLIVFLCGGLFVFFALRYANNKNDVENIIWIGVGISLGIFFYKFFELLAAITWILYLITVISCCILQDFIYRKVYYFQQESVSLRVRDGGVEAFCYSLAIISILVAGFLNYDFENQKYLANKEVSSYLLNKNYNSLGFQHWVRLDKHLLKGLHDLHSFVSSTTRDIMFGLTKLMTILLSINSVLSALIRKFFA